MIVPRLRITERLPGCVGRPRKLLVLGSTGSIGESTLELVRRNRARFEVHSMVAGSNVEKFISQITEFRPKVAAIADKQKYQILKSNLSPSLNVELLCGDDEIEHLSAKAPVDLVVAAISGSAGLRGVISALNSGKRVALANKESLVAAGKLVAKTVAISGADVVPIDSEHCAIFQALQGEFFNDIQRLILTASGGPFRNTPLAEFKNITPEVALKHPNWSMGRKVTIDSASMMNKALEVIEAFWLFGIQSSNIDVVVHPQSVVHSLVEFVDGNMLAQLSRPDMKGAISYALAYPDGRIPKSVERLDLEKLVKLEFETLDQEKFLAPRLAKQCLEQGGFAPALFSLANEIAVEAFLERRIGFDRIVKFVAEALEGESRDFNNLSELLELQHDARNNLVEMIKKYLCNIS